MISGGKDILNAVSLILIFSCPTNSRALDIYRHLYCKDTFIDIIVTMCNKDMDIDEQLYVLKTSAVLMSCGNDLSTDMIIK